MPRSRSRRISSPSGAPAVVVIDEEREPTTSANGKVIISVVDDPATLLAEMSSGLHRDVVDALVEFVVGLIDADADEDESR